LTDILSTNYFFQPLLKFSFFTEKIPADIWFAGVFPYFTVEKPVDNVEKSTFQTQVFSLCFYNYVNLYSVTKITYFILL